MKGHFGHMVATQNPIGAQAPSGGSRRHLNSYLIKDDEEKSFYIILFRSDDTTTGAQNFFYAPYMDAIWKATPSQICQTYFEHILLSQRFFPLNLPTTKQVFRARVLLINPVRKSLWVTNLVIAVAMGFNYQDQISAQVRGLQMHSNSSAEMFGSFVVLKMNMVTHRYKKRISDRVWDCYTHA
ncbi:hypothetical protein AVEN_137155-1 [Araneus ventricosus]|uniref:Uncharacterized protein n=1 Tax=Araneus ventricosus TaxID=182803 RepID=A0A4Y2K7V0_ARAVE|nr:hypothetical protein AVEN_137155-1 [Araneus ventricosus]